MSLASMLQRKTASFFGRENRNLEQLHIRGALASLSKNISWSRQQLDTLSFAAKVLSPLLQGSARTHLIGPVGDGGYQVALTKRPIEWAISIGVGSEIRADLQLARNGANVHLFDPFIKKLPRKHPRFKFYPKGLGISSAGFDTLDELVKIANENFLRSNILMIDIEGSEYESLSKGASSLQSFDQIVIEFHNLFNLIDPQKSIQMLSLLKQLRASHTCISARANNLGGVQPLAGFWVPSVLEATFIRADLLPELLSQEEISQRRRPQTNRSLPAIDSDFIFTAVDTTPFEIAG